MAAGAAGAQKYYNILSMDGGGIRGLISAQALKHMESYAYEYSTEQGYTFPTYDGREGVIAMKDMFDMAAGTSTGSIIAAGLAYPIEKDSTTPKYFVKEVIEIYSTKGDQIFSESEGTSTFVQILVFFLFVFIWGGLFYWIGKQTYDNESVKRNF